MASLNASRDFAIFNHDKQIENNHKDRKNSDESPDDNSGRRDLIRYRPKNTDGFRERKPKQFREHNHRERIDPDEIRDKPTHGRKTNSKKNIHEEITRGIMSEIIFKDDPLGTMRKKPERPKEHKPEIKDDHKKKDDDELVQNPTFPCFALPISTKDPMMTQ
jgi:hypothetical protein